MFNYTLSRSSWAYKFVFGNQKEWTINGYPEPFNNHISLGLFVGLFVSMLIIRPTAFITMTLFELGIYVISFLVDGSYSRGKFPTEMKIVKIEPWPKIFRYRFPPWILLIIFIISNTSYHNNLEEVVEVILFSIMILFTFCSITPESNLPSVKLNKAIEPVMNEKVYLAYCRKLRLSPTLHLID